MSKLTEEQERQLIYEFMHGRPVGACAEKYNIWVREVEHIIRQELIRLEKEK